MIYVDLPPAHQVKHRLCHRLTPPNHYRRNNTDCSSHHYASLNLLPLRSRLTFSFATPAAQPVSLLFPEYQTTPKSFISPNDTSTDLAAQVLNLGGVLPPIPPPTLVGLPAPVGPLIASIVDRLNAAIASLTTLGTAPDDIALLNEILAILHDDIPFVGVGA